jgi:AraC family transcriptional regulator
VLAQTVRGAAEEAQLTSIKDATARLATLLDRLVLKLREPAAMRSRPTRATAQGGLTPSQTVRAEAFLAAHFAEDVTLNDVAAQCRLSPAQFARAFAQTTGVLPNEWLLRYRIDEAKAMMLETSSNMSDIAKSCGFTDKSHFTRVFMRVAGSNPGAWRRDNRLR